MIDPYFAQQQQMAAQAHAASVQAQIEAGLLLAQGNSSMALDAFLEED